MSTAILTFSGFELDIAAYQLSRNGRAVKLERIPMELLLFLVERRGQLVTREEILEKLWGKDTFLDVDNSINTAIAKIRVALRDDPDDPSFIKTVPAKGYRFIAQVTASPDGNTAAPAAGGVGAAGEVPARSRVDERGSTKARSGWLVSATVIAGVVFVAALSGWIWRDGLRRVVSSNRAPTIRSLAVLPLENLTGEASQEYFSDGMTDALITDLAQIGTLRVISRTSVMRYKGTRKPLPEIARELGVDGIIEGTVARSGNRVRITSQLIYAAADQHLWARSYERDLKDVLSLQGDVAQAIADEVRAAVTSEQRMRLTVGTPANPVAYDSYLKGRYFWNQRTPLGARRSVELFQDAVDKDPNFALAWAGLADAYNFSNIMGILAPKESFPRAKAAAAKALALDPLLGEAHAALGLVKSHYDFDFPGAQKEFLRAIELNPNYSDVHLLYAGAYLTPMGRHAEAIEEMKKALALDPISSPLNNMMAETYLWAGDYEKSLQQFKHTIDLDPAFPLARFFFAGLLEAMGRYDEAIEEKQRGDLLRGQKPEDAAQEAAMWRKALRWGGARSYWQKNLEVTLEERKQAGTRYFPAIGVAAAYAKAGDRRNALDWLEKSYQEREGQILTLVRWLPEFESLREEARFKELLKHMGLPDESP